VEEAESIKKSAAVVIAAQLLGKGEEAGVRSTSDANNGAVRDDTKGREADRVQDNIDKIIKVDSNLKSEEESRYKKIWKLFKEVVFPGPEAERLQSKKIEKKTPVKGVVKEVDKEKKEEGKGIFGTILGALGLVGSTLLSALGSIPGLITGLLTSLWSGLGSILSVLGSVGKVLGSLGRLALSFGGVIARAVMSIGRAAAAAGRAIGRAAAAAGRGIARAGRAIGRAAAAAGRGIARAASAAGRGIARAGRAIGRAAASAGRGVARVAGSAGRGIAMAARAAAPALGVAGAVVGAAAIGAAVGTVLENSDMNPIRWLAGMEQKSKEEAADRERMAQHNRGETFKATKLHQARLENLIDLYGKENVKVVEGAIRVAGKSSTAEVRERAKKFNVVEDPQVVAAENALRAYKKESIRLAKITEKSMDVGWRTSAAEQKEIDAAHARQMAHMSKSDLFRKALDDATKDAIKRQQDANRDVVPPKPSVPQKVDQVLPSLPKPAAGGPKVTFPLENVNPPVVPLASNQKTEDTQRTIIQIKSQEDGVDRMVDSNNKSNKLTDRYIKDNTFINKRIASLAEEQTQLLQLVVANISKASGNTTVVNAGNNQNKAPGTFNMRTEFGRSTV